MIRHSLYPQARPRSRRYAVLGAFVGLTALLAGLAAVAMLPPRAEPTEVPMPAAPPRAEVADLEQVVREFVAVMPRRGTETFDTPTDAESAAFAKALVATETGRLHHARELLDPLSYDLVEVRDSVTGAELLLVGERRRADGSWPHGWGLYVLSPDAGSRHIVQVPHPLFDVHTPALGVTAFRHADARALFVAGTHRYANGAGGSDVAHAEQTMFQQATRALVGPGDSVLQFHGFDGAGFPAYGEVVVSDGDAPPSRTSAEVTERLTAAGFKTCLYDGVSCAGLAGTSNVQGRWAPSTGAGFLHIEVVRGVRDDVSLRGRLARLVVEALPGT